MKTSSTLSILGVSGRMGSGKSTVARLAAARLTSATGDEWKVVAFADPLKAFVCKMYDVPACLAYTDIGKKTVPYKVRVATQADLPVPISEGQLAIVNGILQLELPHGPTLGLLFQTFGELFRSFDPDYWIRAFELRRCANVAIEDVRYPNEVAWIRSHNGVVCRVHGPDVVADECVAGRVVTHASETSLSDGDWDFWVDNRTRGEDLSALHRDLAYTINTVML